MEQENQKWDRILRLLFEHSSRRFTIREISKRTNIPSSTVQRYFKALKKQGFLDKENKVIINPYFKFRKAFFIIDKLLKTGLIDYLEKHFIPEVIIVFGSARKGEYEENSDIDIFISSTKQPKIDMSFFEKRMGHKIQLFIERDINNLPPNLLNNVANGIKLRGYFKIR